MIVMDDRDTTRLTGCPAVSDGTPLTDAELAAITARFGAVFARTRVALRTELFASELAADRRAVRTFAFAVVTKGWASCVCEAPSLIE